MAQSGVTMSSVKMKGVSNGAMPISANGSNGRRRGSLASVVGALHRYIVDNSLRPGDRLPTERELIQQLGVSRSVLREALRELQAQRMIVARHGHGLHVLPYGPAL